MVVVVVVVVSTKDSVKKIFGESMDGWMGTCLLEIYLDRYVYLHVSHSDLQYIPGYLSTCFNPPIQISE